jgi:hypothetical protein
MVEISILSETKPSGTNGGASVGQAWNERVYNNISSNQTTGWCSLNTITGEITLKAGKYQLNGKAIGVGVGSHQLRVRNMSNNTSNYGLSSLSYALTPGNSSVAEVDAYININGARTFKIEHFCEKSVANFGLGFSTSISGNNEVYSSVVITKL